MHDYLLHECFVGDASNSMVEQRFDFANLACKEANDTVFHPRIVTTEEIFSKSANSIAYVVVCAIARPSKMKYGEQRLHAVRNGDSFTNFGQYFQGNSLTVGLFNTHVLHSVEDVMYFSICVMLYAQAAC